MTETPRITRELIAAMRDSANVMEVANKLATVDPDARWRPGGMRILAANWERQLDAEEALIEQLTTCVAGTMTDSPQYKHAARERSAPIVQAILADFDVKPKGANE